MATQKQIQKAIESVLFQIIDEWYEKVSNFYVTKEKASSSVDEELKRFHDEKGHRIKFNKDNLDFTYGLRSYWEDDNLRIEVSVNNKVNPFNYEDFKKRLAAYYRKTGKQPVPTPYELRNHSYEEVFELQRNFSEAFAVEIREGKADIMRLSFRLNPDYLDKLVEHPVSSKELIENYCVTPLRTVYATVYRRSSG